MHVNKESKDSLVRPPITRETESDPSRLNGHLARPVVSEPWEIAYAAAMYTMRKASMSLLLLGTLVVVVAGNSPQTVKSQDEQQLRQIEATTAKCEQQNDASMMSLFADDFVVSGKKVLSKQQVEEAVRNNLVAHGNGPSPYTIKKKNMQVYLFGDTAVVTYIRSIGRHQIPRSSSTRMTPMSSEGSKGWLLQFSKVSPAAFTSAS
jgi:ketosteroid isomerase-like protein